MIISTLNQTPQTNSGMLTKLSAILLVLLISLTTSWVSAQTAALSTDQADYGPGTTATFTGTGFTAGETVTVVVHHADGTPDSGADHEPWTVDADLNGDFVTTWHVCEDDCVGSTLRVTADGVSSGLHAEAIFTDAPGTDPFAHALSGSNFTFTGFASGATTAYPTSMQGWNFTAELTAANLTSAPAGDFALTANAGAIATGSIRNEGSNGISILNSGSNNLGAIVVALNATGRSDLRVTFTAQQLNDGNTKSNGLRLQYRLGTSGSFTDVSPTTEYLTTVNGTAAAQTFTNIALPPAVNNQAVVQLRWVYYIITNNPSSGRDRIRLDDITISSSLSCSPPTITQIKNCNGTSTLTTTTSGNWSTGATGTEITVNAAGTYTVSVGGCDGSITISTPPNTLPKPTVAAGGATAFCQGGNVVLTSSTATGNTWSTGATTQSITVTTSGSYTVTVANECGSKTSDATVVTVTPTLVVSKSITQPSCAGDDGTVSVSATGGNGTYAGTGTFTVAAGTAYNFPVSSGTCSGSASGTMASPAAIIITSSATPILCANGSSSVTIAATGGTGTLTGTGTFAQSIASKAYTVTDANGCSKTITVNITIPSAISLSEVVTNVSCFGGNNGAIDLTVGGGSPANPGGTVTYTQDFNTLATSGTSTTLPSGWFLMETGANANTSYAAGTGSDNAGNTYSYGSTGSTDRSLGTLLSGNLVSTVGAGSLFINNTGNIVKSLSINYTGEQWRLGATGRGADKLDFQYSTNATSLSTGTWIEVNALDFTSPVTTGTVGPLDGNTAANRTALTATITGLTIPINGTFWIRWLDLDVTSSDDGLGIDDFSMTMNSVTSPYNYLWNPGNATTEDIATLTAGTYTVTVKDANGCIATKPITIAAPSAISFTATPTQPKCFGEKGSVILSTPTGGTGAINFDATAISALDEGDYTYTATDANGCTAQQTVHINAAPAAISFTATPTQPKCFGEKGSVVLSTPTGGSGAINFDATATSGLSAGDYTYTATDGNGCTAQQTVHINAAPSAISFTATATQPKCFGEKGSVTLSTPTGGTGAISFNGTATTALAAGDYTYIATDANGCTAQQTVHINAAPAAISFTATPTQPKCVGEKGSVVLSTPTGGTGAINFNATATSGLSAGDYTYTATDANGCTAQQTVHINAAPSAISFTATATQPKCFGEKGSVVLSTPTGGTGAITFDATPTSGLNAGSYTYTATDANGCTAKQTIQINAAPAALVASCKTNTPDNTLYFGYTGDQTETITVAPTGGTAPYTVQFTLSRSIKCNQVNDAGDEIWTASGGITTGTGCPVYPNTTGPTPLSTKTNIGTGGNYAVTVTLMENAYVIATITDGNGCVTTCSTYVHADDVRCFAGNSGVTKVTLCHKTGSSKTPCVTICVDNDAVSEHLAHGDFLGKCTANCVAPATKPAVPIVAPVFASELTVKVMPNPTPNYFNVAITGKNNSPVTVRVMDIYGRTLQVNQKIAANSTLRLGQKWTGGTYIIEVMQGEERKVVKVIKAN